MAVAKKDQEPLSYARMVLRLAGTARSEWYRRSGTHTRMDGCRALMASQSPARPRPNLSVTSSKQSLNRVRVHPWQKGLRDPARPRQQRGRRFGFDQFLGRYRRRRGAWGLRKLSQAIAEEWREAFRAPTLHSPTGNLGVWL